MTLFAFSLMLIVSANNGQRNQTKKTDTTMKKTLGTNQIVSLLMEDENAGWSYSGAQALAEYLEDYEESTGQELEFDRVAIRCDFSEYERAKDAALDYSWHLPERDEDESDEDYHDRTEEDALEYLRDNTTVIEFDGGVIIQNF